MNGAGTYRSLDATEASVRLPQTTGIFRHEECWGVLLAQGVVVGGGGRVDLHEVVALV